jgi:hypothetical protein
VIGLGNVTISTSAVILRCYGNIVPWLGPWPVVLSEGKRYLLLCRRPGGLAVAARPRPVCAGGRRGGWTGADCCLALTCSGWRLDPIASQRCPVALMSQ